MLKKDVQVKISGLALQINFIEDAETLKCVRTYVNSAMSLIKAKQSQYNSLVPTSRQPAKKLIERQRPFFQQKGREKRQVYG